jgi:hypothetical protein
VGILRDSRPALRIFSPTPSRSRGIPTDSPGLSHCGIPFWGSSWNRRAYLGIGLQNNSYHKPILNQYLKNEFVIDMSFAKRSLVLTNCDEVYVWGCNEWNK